MRYRIAFALVACVAGLAGVLALAGCGSSSGSSVTASSGSAMTTSAEAADTKLAEAINGFGFNLLAEAAREATGNPVVSPASVHAALSMTANGATAETLDQMRSVLKVDGMSVADANGAWQRLMTRLTAKSEASQTLEVANALIGRKDVEFKQPFLEANQRSFGARLSAMDFASDNVAGEINRWVSGKTHGMIPKMIDRIDPAAILYLMNAVYFKGEWMTPFKARSTSKHEFTRADGSKTEVKMMQDRRDLPYYASSEYQATRLDYKGNRTDFYLVLPKPGFDTSATLSALERGGLDKLRRSLASTASTEVDLGLPKLDSDCGAEFSGPLKAMGMPRAFDTESAQFSEMADRGTPVCISRVLHKTKVRVDEKGTEAAAATVVEMTEGAMYRPAPKLVCDHPYIFAIADRQSGALLFLGVVNDPNAK